MKGCYCLIIHVKKYSKIRIGAKLGYLEFKRGIYVYVIPLQFYHDKKSLIMINYGYHKNRPISYLPGKICTFHDSLFADVGSHNFRPYSQAVTLPPLSWLSPSNSSTYSATASVL